MRHELPESITEQAVQKSPQPWPPQAPDAVFFGTFNPITTAHTHLLEAAHVEQGFKNIWVIPAFGSPFKYNDPAMTAYEHRLTMTQLACQRYPWATVSPIESWITESSQPCFSSSVVEALAQHYADLASPLPFIIGIDALMGLPRWHHAKLLVQYCEFWVAPRPDHPDIETGIDTLRASFPTIRHRTLPLSPMTTSSSSIRAKIQQENGEIPVDLHPDVWHYIREHGLYQTH